MIRSMQEIAFSMRTQTDRINVIANNIANIETRAYKREVASVKSFDDVMAKAMQYNSGGTVGDNVGPMSLGAAIDEKRIIFEQGYISNTGFNTDFAIRGDGFFVLDTVDGPKYTKAGNFAFNEQGFLITQDGDYVMGENGRIQVPTKKLTVDNKGNIVSDAKLVDKFKLVSFNNLNLLKRENGGVYTSDAQNIKNPIKVELLQSFIENSNVNVVEETRDLMDTKRNYESGQQMIKMIDDTLGKAASEIGRL